MQDLCMRISCARPLCQDVCIRILYRTSCARSLYDIRNRNFTSISHDGHARSPQRVALRNPKSQFHLHSAHLTRTISAEGCTSKSKNAISPAFRALDTHDLRRRFTFRNHASEVLRLPRNHEPRSYEMLHWPRKRIKRNPSNDTHLPTFWQRPRNIVPATIFTMCPIPCTCHVNSRF